MKRLIAFTVLVGLLTAAAATLGSAAPVGDSGPIGSGQAAGQAEAPCSARGGQGPRRVGDRCQMRHPAVRLAGHERPQPRLRRRGRTPVREVGVRVGEQGPLHVRDDGEPHRNADVGPGGHHRLDAHLDRRAREDDRLLRSVLRRGREAARQERGHGREAQRLHEGQEGRLHVGVDLRPLDQELLQGDDVPGRLEPERRRARGQERAG